MVLVKKSENATTHKRDKLSEEKIQGGWGGRVGNQPGGKA